MIKVSVFYPNSPGAKFDMAYYTTKHMPMVQKKVTTCKGIAAEQGLSAATGDARNPILKLSVAKGPKLCPLWKAIAGWAFFKS